MKVIYSRYTRYTNVLYTFEVSERKVPLFDPNSATIHPELWHYSLRIRHRFFPCKTRQKQTVPSADVVSLHRDSEITERCAKLKAYV